MLDSVGPIEFSGGSKVQHIDTRTGTQYVLSKSCICIKKFTKNSINT